MVQVAASSNLGTEKHEKKILQSQKIKLKHYGYGYLRAGS